MVMRAPLKAAQPAQKIRTPTITMIMRNPLQSLHYRTASTVSHTMPMSVAATPVMTF
jgi:hypothetical protein